MRPLQPIIESPQSALKKGCMCFKLADIKLVKENSSYQSKPKLSCTITWPLVPQKVYQNGYFCCCYNSEGNVHLNLNNEFCMEASKPNTTLLVGILHQHGLKGHLVAKYMAKH